MVKGSGADDLSAARKQPDRQQDRSLS